MKPYKVDITKSDSKDKKLKAVFYNKDGDKMKTQHFGAQGMSDFTKHKDTERKKRYLDRHKKNENWSNPMSAGSLSKNILWNKPTLSASISDFKKNFGLK